MKIRGGKEGPVEPSSGEQYYEFKMERYHTQKAKRGSKLYVCDLCQGAFKRSFSLKRHYLRFHINYAYLSPRDLNNCAIVLGDKQISATQAPLSREPGCFCKLYRCHQCGFLVDTKEDLILHLDTHPIQEELVRGSNRCPRCSTAFSLRKTLRRHIKKNRCRGAVKDIPSPVVEDEAASGESGRVDPLETEDTEEIDMEVSLSLGCSTSMFRYSCTLCSKMFSSYVNMCRHRSLAHGGYGICSPHFLASRKVKHVPLYRFSPTKTATDQARTSNGSTAWNVSDNVNIYVDGKVYYCLPEPEGDGLVTARSSCWQWRSSVYDLHDVARLDIPVQQAFQRSLSVWNEIEEKTSHCSNDDVLSSLGLVQSLPKADPVEQVEPVEFSGEWTRLKKYICSVCLRAHDDFFDLEDHQKLQHANVWCSHYEVDPAPENMPPANLEDSQDPAGLPAAAKITEAVNCTKCSFKAQSVGDLHSHVLICSNHVNTSPVRRKRNHKGPNGNPSRGKKWRPAPGGRSRGMKRSFSSTSQIKSRRSKLNEVIPDPAMRRSTRRVLNFTEVTSAGKPPRKILRSSVDLSISSVIAKSLQTSQTKINKKASVNTKSKLKPSSSSSSDISTTTNNKSTPSKKNKDPSPATASKKIPKKSENNPKSTSPTKKTTAAVKNSTPAAKNSTSVAKNSTSAAKNTTLAAKKSTSTAKNTTLGAKKSTLAAKTSTSAGKNSTADNSYKTKVKSKSKNAPEVEPAPSKTDLTCSFCKRNFFKPSTLSKHEEVCTSRHPLIIVCDMVAAEERSRTVPAKKNQPRKKQTPAEVKRETKSSKGKVENSVTRKKTAVKRETLRGMKESFTSAERKRPRKEAKNGNSPPVAKKSRPEVDVKPARPVRSSRKSSLLWSLNCSSDEIEPSFIEALSPEQRIRVAEQKCPFCAKRYVYKSNFKRHLLEGCDTADEPPEPKPQPKKGPVSNKTKKAKKSLPAKEEKEQKEKKKETTQKKGINKTTVKKVRMSTKIAAGETGKSGNYGKSKEPRVPEGTGKVLDEIQGSGETEGTGQTVMQTGEAEVCEQTGEPGQSLEEIEDTGESRTSEETAQPVEEIEGTGEPGQPLEEIEVPGEIGDTGESGIPEETRQLREEIGGTGEPGKPCEKFEDSKEVEISEETKEVSQNGEAGAREQTGEPGKLEETGKTGELGKAGSTGEIGEIDNIDGTGQLGNSEEPGDIEEPGKTVESGKITEPGETLSIGGSGETQETAGTGETAEPLEAGDPGTLTEPGEPLDTDDFEKTAGFGNTGVTGDSEEPGKTSKPGHFVQSERIEESGQSKMIAEVVKIEAPGEFGEPGYIKVSKQPRETKETGGTELENTEEPEETGEPANSGETRESEEPGQTGKTGVLDEPTQIGETGKVGSSEEPGQTGELEEPGEPGQIEETGKGGSSEEPGQTEKIKEVGSFGEPGQTEESGKAGSSGEPGQTEKTEELEELEELGEPGQTGQTEELGEPGQSEETGQIEETGQVGSSEEPVQTEETDETGKAESFGELGQTGELEERGEPGQTEKTGKVASSGEPGQTEGNGEPKEPGHTEGSKRDTERPEAWTEDGLPPSWNPKEILDTEEGERCDGSANHFNLNCPVCNEMMNADDVQQLNEHIKEKHMTLDESEIPLQSQMSLALNGLLEKALDTAMTTGFLRSYSTVTKVPVKIQRLQALALNYRAGNNQTSFGGTSE